MVDLNILTANAPELTNLIGKFIYIMYNAIGNFGWTVVVFTIILKVILSPLDFWQKHVTRKNNKAMKKMAPELEKLKKQFGSDPRALQQKQMALYKKEGYSMWGSCLPTIITLVIFFVVFGGFNACVKYENETLLYNMTNYYIESVESVELTAEEEQAVLDSLAPELSETSRREEVVRATVAKRDAMMLEKYNELAGNKHRWLWIQNVFVSDNWNDPVASLDKYVGTGLGNIGGTLPDNLKSFVKPDGIVYSDSYNTVMGAAIREYSKQGSSGVKKAFDMKHWNGYLVLPVLAVALSIISNKLMKGSQPEQPPQTDSEGKPIDNKNMMKYMNLIMPIMIGVFSIFYSAAFAIYMLFNSLITVLFNLVYNLITTKKDKAEEEHRLANTYKR